MRGSGAGLDGALWRQRHRPGDTVISLPIFSPCGSFWPRRRRFPDERDHLPIAVGSLAVFATGLVDHAEAIVAIVHVGKQHQEVAGGLFSLVELARLGPGRQLRWMRLSGRPGRRPRGR